MPVPAADPGAVHDHIGAAKCPGALRDEQSGRQSNYQRRQSEAMRHGRDGDCERESGVAEETPVANGRRVNDAAAHPCTPLTSDRPSIPTPPAMPRSRAISFAIAASLVLPACNRADDVTGSPTMPANFGAVQTAVLSCPDLEGIFAFPAAQGHPFGYAGNATRRGAQYRDFFGLPLYGASHVWVRGPRLGEAQPLTLRTRMVNATPVVSSESTLDWNRVELSAGEYDCQEGWLNVTERDWEQPGAAAWFGGSGVRIAARVTRLTDGSLVVGQAVRVWGRRSAISIANRTLFTMTASDHVTWYWTRFARVNANGGEGPANDTAPVKAGETIVMTRDRSAVVVAPDSIP